jgi:hypothetical protein
MTKAVWTILLEALEGRDDDEANAARAYLLSERLRWE